MGGGKGDAKKARHWQEPLVVRVACLKSRGRGYKIPENLKGETSMAVRFVLLLVMGFVATSTGAAAGELHCGGKFVACELYSWTDSSGQWRFSLLPSASGASLTPDRVFDKNLTLSGIEELQEKMAKLPKGSKIIWLGELKTGLGLDIKQTGTVVGLPPSLMVAKIKAWAELHNLTIAIVDPGVKIMDFTIQEPVRVHLAVLDLYSWTDASGEWRFCLLPSLSGRQYRVEEILDTRITLKGVDELERKMDELPEGTGIFWNESVAACKWIKCQETFAYPPANMMGRIRAHAELHYISLDIFNSGKEWFAVPGVGPNK